MDGSLFLFADDELKIELHDINFREDGAIQIHGVHYNTFFGGSSASWAPTKDEKAFFRNFEIGGYSDSQLPSKLDVNECENGDHNCGENALCTNTVEDFTCTCEPGFTGDGIDCSDQGCKINSQSLTTLHVENRPGIRIIRT